MKKTRLIPMLRLKAIIERVLRDYAAAYGIGSVALRYFSTTVSGLGCELGEVHEPESHIMTITLLVAAGMRERLSAFGTNHATRDGDCIQDYIHVCDLADAHVAAIGVIEPSNSSYSISALATASQCASSSSGSKP